MDYKESLSSLQSQLQAYQTLPSLLDDVIRQGYYERLYNLIYYTVLDNGRHSGVGDPLKIILNKAVDQVIQDIERVGNSSKVSHIDTSRINYDVDVDPLDRPQSERSLPKPIMRQEGAGMYQFVSPAHRSQMSTESRISRASTAKYRQSYTFSREERWPRKDRSPGPADYDTTMLTRERSPKMVFSKQIRKSQFGQDDNKPGPGEYDPINQQFKNEFPND